MKLQHVPIEFVNVTWPRIEKFVSEASKYGEDYTTEQIKVYLNKLSNSMIVIDYQNSGQGRLPCL